MRESDSPAEVTADAPANRPQPAASPLAESPHYDRWETEEHLRHIGRVLHPHLRSSTKGKTPRRNKTRIHAAHAATPGWHRNDKRRVPAKTRKGPGDSGTTLTVWTAISLGVMLLACGGMLLGWSVLGPRADLWSIGLPIAIAGQVLLLFGLVLQLERLWHHHRDAAARLAAVDRQLHDLRSTTALLGTTHSAPAAAFYSHMAGGASPQLLLADLKGQLDLLALQMRKIDD
jgi:hypothetical protein